MTPAQFVAAYRPTAEKVEGGTGIDPIALLSQWANETAWGTSWAGAPFNLGNIESNGVVIHYRSLDDFAAACIATFHNGRYQPVLAATNAVDQLAAIVASPWSAGHYGGSLMAYYTQVEAFEMTPEEHQWLSDIHQSIGSNPATPGQTVQGALGQLETEVAALKAQIAALPSGVVDLRPVLAAIANVQSSLTPIQAGVTAIKTKTDKDLA